jgi:protein-S-isoprenylcysteine O-methyltransferase Ste14
MLILLRPLGLALWIATLAYLLQPQWMQWSQWPLPALLRWLGLPIALLGDLMLYGSLSYLGKNLTDTVAVRPQATLVTGGPYRYVRHPFYVAVTVIFAGFVLLTANWLIGLFGLLIMTLLAVRTRREEAELIARFGDDYRRYMSATGRFLPRWDRRPVAKDF